MSTWRPPTGAIGMSPLPSVFVTPPGPSNTIPHQGTARVTNDRPPVPEAMRDHWWWRPGWSQGRSFYTWHITFDGQPGMQQLADFYAPMLANLPMLDAVPVKWLHLTMQGIGFTD